MAHSVAGKVDAVSHEEVLFFAEVGLVTLVAVGDNLGGEERVRRPNSFRDMCNGATKIESARSSSCRVSPDHPFRGKDFPIVGDSMFGFYETYAL